MTIKGYFNRNSEIWPSLSMSIRLLNILELLFKIILQIKKLRMYRHFLSLAKSDSRWSKKENCANLSNRKAKKQISLSVTFYSVILERSLIKSFQLVFVFWKPVLRLESLQICKILISGISRLTLFLIVYIPALFYADFFTDTDLFFLK